MENIHMDFEKSNLFDVRKNNNLPNYLVNNFVFFTIVSVTS